MKGPEKVCLQHMEWNGSRDLPDALFFCGPVEPDGDGFRIRKNEKAAFDRYFNLFSLRKYRKYTMVDGISFSVEIRGKAGLTIWGVPAKKEKQKEVRIAGFAIGTEETFLSFETGQLPVPEGIDYLYAEFDACTDICVRKASWNGTVPFVRQVSIAVGICTYKREKELKRSMDEVITGIYEKENADLSGSPDIFIADNGHTLLQSEFSHPEKIKIFPNRNYGGSAGFTRCLIEACFYSSRKYTHILLLDDDAMMKSFVLARIRSLLTVLKEEYTDHFLGGALFSRSKPLQQKENGAFMGKYSQKVLFHGKNKVLDSREKATENEEEKKVNYNGWFLCCIPVEIIREDNLPLPLFVRGDDQEFAKRNRAKIITMNGIAVWHPDPHTVRRPYMGYYEQRNELILAAELEKKLKKTAVCAFLVKRVMRCITKYKYEDAWYILRGEEDFYRGIEDFLRKDPQKHHEDLTGWKPYRSEIVTEADRMMAEIPRERPLAIRAVRGICNLVMPDIRDRKVYRSEDTWIPVDNFCTRRILIIDPSGDRGIVLERNRREMMRILGKTFQLMGRILRTHDTVFPEWSEKVRSLESLSFWEKYLYGKGGDPSGKGH